MGKILTGRFTKQSIVKTLGSGGIVRTEVEKLLSSLKNMKRVFRQEQDKNLFTRSIIKLEKIKEDLRKLQVRAKKD
jgi:hypothetical protein